MGEANKKKIQELIEKRKKWKEGGGEARVKRQHDRGKLTARERMNLLFDNGSFVEYNIWAAPDCDLHGLNKEHAPGDGVVVGYGKVNGRLTYAVAQDFTVLGGTMGQNHCKKINHASEEAARNGCPCVYMWDGGGGRIQEAHYRDVIKCTMLAAKNSGYIPTVSVIMGACAGGSAYAPILNDFMICVDKTSKFYLCGPDVVEAVTGEKVDGETLAGAWTENVVSGNAQQWACNDEEAIWHVKKYLSYMPQNCKEKTTIYSYDDDIERRIPELDDIIPDDPKKSYDCHRVLELIADKDSLYEYQPYWARNIVCSFGRIMGETVGFIINNTEEKAGCFDIDASDKFARFVDILDCYNIPMITLTDTPGFLPGKNQELGGIIRHGAKTLEAAYRATVPKIQVVLRKNVGGACLPMGYNLFNLDVNLYWPSYDYGIMNPESACKIIMKRKMKADPEHADQILNDAIKEFTEARTPYSMCAHMWADDIIEPNETRMRLIKALELLRNKNPKMIPVPERDKKHSVSPR